MILAVWCLQCSQWGDKVCYCTKAMRHQPKLNFLTGHEKNHLCQKTQVGIADIDAVIGDSIILNVKIGGGRWRREEGWASSSTDCWGFTNAETVLRNVVMGSCFSSLQHHRNPSVVISTLLLRWQRLPSTEGWCSRIIPSNSCACWKHTVNINVIILQCSK